MNLVRKGMFLFVAALLLAPMAHAATCQLGVKGGVAIQSLGGDDVESDDLESRTGFAGGGYFQADFNRNFGLRLEALYYMKGATADSADFELAFNLDYIEVPVLAVLNFPVGETGRFNLFAGPTLGINVGADAEASVAGFSASFDISDAVPAFEFGLAFGAGLNFDAGPVILGFDGRYGLGLTTVIDGDADLDGDGTPDLGGNDIDVTNKGFAFMASLGFPLGEK